MFECSLQMFDKLMGSEFLKIHCVCELDEVFYVFIHYITFIHRPFILF